MEKKYILTNQSRIEYGYTLHRIQAVKSFYNVKKGDFGGWIEKEDNLSQEGTCWVYDEAKVFGGAQVYDNAEVRGKAKVFGRAMICGEARVYEDAEVYGEAQVYAKAQVYGKAVVHGEAQVCEAAAICGSPNIYGPAHVSLNAHVSSQKDVKLIGPIGSRGKYTTFARNKDNDILVFCGCFKGTIDDFETRVREVHKGTEYEKEYLNAIEYARKELNA